MGRADGLRVYHAALELQGQVNKMTRELRRVPSDFKSQLQDAARSVPACIAEGFGRGTPKEELHYLRMARGSLDEVRHDLRTCVSERYITEKRFYPLWNLAKVIRRMITNLMRQRGSDD